MYKLYFILLLLMSNTIQAAFIVGDGGPLDSVVMRFSTIELSTLYEPQPGMRMYF